MIASPPPASQPFLFGGGCSDKIVPKCLLSFRKKSPAPLITKQTFEMWNEFKATCQCVLKSLGTCNNSSWTCELSYWSQQSANSKVKLNRGHMVQWLDRYFGICDVQVCFILNHTENGNLHKSFGRRFKPHILPNRDLGVGWCQNGRALPPALPCHPSMAGFAWNPSFWPQDWKSTQNICKVPDCTLWTDQGLRVR